MKPRFLAASAAVALAAGLLGACSTPASGPPALHVLAGSELKDLEPLLPDLLQATGINLKFDYIGTLDGAQAISTGDANPE